MPAILPASRVRAGIRVSRTSTTRLAFSSTTPLSTRLPKVAMVNEQHPGHRECGRLVVGPPPGHYTELDVSDPDGSEQGRQLGRGSIPARRGPLLARRGAGSPP